MRRGGGAKPISVYIDRHFQGTTRILKIMTAKDLRRIPRSRGCVETRQRGSHVRIECGNCVTTCRSMREKTLDQACSGASSAILSRVSGRDG
jgi:hypothetical protein